jgi:hypothetical protein
MPRGNTATIVVTAFHADWMAHVTMRDLCDRHSVSRDQVVRLRDYWHLPKRHDRKLRKKPERLAAPTPEEIAASEQSLSLAPMIAARVTCVQISWTEATRHERQVTKPTMFSLTRIELTNEARDAMESWDD